MPAVTKHRPLARGDACQSCKTRKIRCPAEKPACANCVKKNKECVYNTPTSDNSHPIQADQPNISDTFPMTDFYPTFPPTTSTAIDRSPNGHSIAGSTGRMSISSQHPASAFNLSNGTPAMPSSSSQNPSPLDGSPWMSDFGMIGALPSMMGPVQTLPSEWKNLDLTALLGQGALKQETSPVENIELSETERDHLLLQYFTGHRIFGVDMHISTFYTRVQSPDPLIRPHACLLNAIYLMTCRGSPIESLRRQEDSFYIKAKEAMDQAMASPDYVFDSIRTGTMLSSWLFGAERHMEGWAMLGQTVRIAIAAGLDRIQSSADIDQTHHADGRRKRGISTFLRPAVTILELADRIYAFWTLFMVDICTSIAFDFPPGFHHDRILTPLPRPWAEYETNDSHLTTCDIRLPQLYQDSSLLSSPCGRGHMAEVGYTLGALDLVHQATQKPPLAERLRLAQAVTTLDKNIPSELKGIEKSQEGTSTVSSDTATIQFIMTYAEMFLYCIDVRERPDPRALEAARRILGILHLLKDANIGDVNLFAIIIWCRVARLLVWESKRLEASGDAFAAATFANDVQFITSFLKQLSHIHLAAEARKSIQMWWEDDLSTFGVEYVCQHLNPDRPHPAKEV